MGYAKFFSKSSSTTFDNISIKRIMDSSNLAHMQHSNGTQKWLDDKNYANKTIEKALSDVIRSYNPNFYSPEN